MAKKRRTPPPPRRVQAPKRRSDPKNPRRMRLLLAALAAAIVVAAAGVGIAMVRGGDADDGALAASGCDVESLPSQGREHVQKLEKGFEYNSFPATSGPHHPDPAVWNMYDQPVDEIHLVHNLEHGGIVVQYGNEASDATVEAIREWYSDDPNGIVVAPRPKLGDTIALTAWRTVAKCSSFDEEAFSAFRDEHRYKGPERIPPEFLTPGS